MNKRALKTMILILLTLPSILHALDMESFSAEYREILNSGSAHIRSVSRYRDLLLADIKNHPFLETLKDMNPNYLAEAFILIPADDPTKLLEELSSGLMDFESWKAIPYWSVQQETWYDLFSEAVVEETRTEGTQRSWITSFVMQPFTRYRTRTDITREKDRLIFNSRNEDEIAYAYNGMRAIKKHKMHWFVEAEIAPEGLIIYGVGAVYAFDMFGVIRKRLETSLVGRMRAFFSWQFDRLLPAKSE